MSDYFFGVTKAKITKKEAARRQRIAAKHGATFVGPVDLPGNQSTGWFACPNRGEPFDSQIARAVMAELGHD